MRKLRATVVLALAGLLFYASGVAKAEQHQPSWGYAHIGGVLSPYGAGKIKLDVGDTEADLTQKFSGGVHLSGYYILNNMIHLGLYFNYITGKGKIESGGNSAEGDVGQIGVGASIKVGGKVHDRIWLGFVGDLGYYNLSIDTTFINDSYSGFEISPRFHIDVLAFDVNGFKMGGFFSVGPSFVPYFGGSVNTGFVTTDFKAWLITIQIRLGLTFGA